MQSILYVALQGFYVTHLRNVGEGDSRLLVVTYEGRILDCDSEAFDRKICLDMNAGEAKTILREHGRFVELDPACFADAQSLWLDRGLIYTNSIEPESPHAAYFDFSGHPDAVDAAQLFLRDLQEFTGLQVKAGLAVSKWVAKLGASICDDLALKLGVPVLEPIVDAGEWLRGLPTKFLTPVDSGDRDRLIALGYRRIGQVAQAPLDALIGQFGKQGLRIYESARGKALERLTAVYPPLSLSLEHRFDGEVDSRLALDEVVKELAIEAEFGLSERDMQAGSVLFWIESGNGVRHGEKRDLVKFVRSARSFQVIFEQLLDRLNWHESIARIGVLLLKLKSVFQVQQSLGGQTSSLDRTVAAQSAYSRARMVYGKGVMKVGGEIELPRRLEVLKAWRMATGWRF